MQAAGAPLRALPLAPRAPLPPLRLPPGRIVPQAGRSPRSTMSEGAEKRAAQAKPPSAVASAAQQRPASPGDAPSSSSAEQQQAQQQQGQRPGAGSPWWREQQRAKRRAAGMTPLEEYMRDTPGLDRFLDLPLMFGDIVMLLATEVRLILCQHLARSSIQSCSRGRSPPTPPAPAHPRAHALAQS